jgi:hypothetical protein
MLKPFKIMRKKKQERNRNFLNHRKWKLEIKKEIYHCLKKYRTKNQQIKNKKNKGKKYRKTEMLKLQKTKNKQDRNVFFKLQKMKMRNKMRSTKPEF